MPTNEKETIVGYDFAKSLIKAGTKEAFNNDPTGKTITFHAKGINPETKKEVDLGTIEVIVVGILEKPARQWIEGRNIYLSDKLSDQLFQANDENTPTVNVYADSAKRSHHDFQRAA